MSGVVPITMEKASRRRMDQTRLRRLGDTKVGWSGWKVNGNILLLSLTSTTDLFIFKYDS